MNVDDIVQRNLLLARPCHLSVLERARGTIISRMMLHSLYVMRCRTGSRCNDMQCRRDVVAWGLTESALISPYSWHRIDPVPSFHARTTRLTNILKSTFRTTVNSVR